MTTGEAPHQRSSGAPRGAEHEPLSSLKAALFSALGALFAAYISLVALTTRWRWIGREHWDDARRRPRLVAAVWHGRLLPLVMVQPKDGRPVVALISANRDGEYIARALKPFGVSAVRGSSRDPNKPGKPKGGAAAAPALVAAARAGGFVVVTPDGPRGPIFRAKPGVATVSAAADAPVLAFSASMSAAIVFKSWDRFMLPLPFGRGAVACEPVVEPSAREDRDALEAKRAEIEAALYRATLAADAAVGRTTPEQGQALSPSGRAG